VTTTKNFAATNRIDSLLSVGICPTVTDASKTLYTLNAWGLGNVSLTVRGHDVDFKMDREEFDARLADGRIIVL
jgi:hypothetical protein